MSDTHTPFMTTTHLDHLLAKQTRKRWQVPSFQRAPVWDEQKIRSWIRTIERWDGSGMITTYSLTGEDVVYLLDGRQRMFATERYVENPRAYGSRLTSDQALDRLEKFTIGWEHKVFASHIEAMEYFKAISQGERLTALEYNIGVLAIKLRGRGELGVIL